MAFVRLFECYSDFVFEIVFTFRPIRLMVICSYRACALAQLICDYFGSNITWQSSQHLENVYRELCGSFFKHISEFCIRHIATVKLTNSQLLHS